MVAAGQTIFIGSWLTTIAQHGGYVDWTNTLTAVPAQPGLIDPVFRDETFKPVPFVPVQQVLEPGLLALLGAGAPSAAQLAGADAVVALRQSGNADVAAFVSGGGLLITEWSAAEWALDGASLLNADGGANAFIGTNTPVTHTAAGLALGLGTGLPNPYADGPRTEFQWTLSNIGPGVSILATIPGNVPAILGGAVGSGYALINSLDWADSFPANGSPSGTWLLNALNVQGGKPVPEPGTLALLGLGLAGLGLSRRRKA